MDLGMGLGAQQQSRNANANANQRSRNQTPVQVQRQEPEQVTNSNLIHYIPKLLPHERVFPIQIGCEVFKLSGASISSDAPSYFSQYFQAQVKQAEETGEDLSNVIRTLYIDRDPETFRDISLHLQGYHVQPRDATHFVRLFADAQFYSLPKLMSQLYEESVFTSIGHREFQVPRELFTDPGNSPNFFSLGFAIFFSNKEEVFPGLDREGLLRPPSIVPPSVPNRSADVFEELLHLMRGYPVRIRDEVHRAELLRDCRYFNFKGLEQRLIPHDISFNQTRQREEILLRLRDILKSGITVAPEPTAADPLAGWVNYARPYVDDRAYELVLEIGEELTRLHFNHSSSGSNGIGGGGGPLAGISIRAEFFRDARTRVAKLFEVIATKLNLPPTTQPLGLLMSKGGISSQPPTPGNTPLSEDLVRVILDPEASVTLDGKPWSVPFEEDNDAHLLGSSNTHRDDVSAPPSSAGGGGIGGAGLEDLNASPSSTTAPPPPLPLATYFSPSTSGGPSRKRRRIESSSGAAGYVPSAGGTAAAISGGEEWIVRTGQWRLRIQAAKNGKAAVECVLVAVKLDAMSCEQSRNAQRGFLGG